MMKIQAIVFDLDGTISDTIPLTIYSLKEVTKELTGKVLSDEEILREFGPVDTEIIKKLVDNHHRESSVEKYIQHFRDNFENYVKPIDGIDTLIRHIKSQGIQLGLFTGRGERAAKIVLEKLGLSSYFDIILSGECAKEPKPHPEGILKALEALGAKSDQSIYVGDFDVDIMASKAAGTKSVLALWSSTKSRELIDLKPDKYFYSPLEFVDWLKSINHEF